MLAEVPKGGRIFIAVSGGVDSMLLLEALIRYAKNQPLHIVHINHGLRGKESAADADLVRNVAAKLSSPFHFKKLSAVKGQLACRKARYEFIQGLADKAEDRIFLAHHLDDQAETVLLRLLRGTGVRGLAGMRKKTGKLLRPLLSFSKKEILILAKEWGLRWREDASNLSKKYERNWIRLEILPLLEARRPGVAERLAALAEEASSLKPQMGKMDSFSWNGCSFYRSLPKSTAFLSEFFSLNRAHSNALAAILNKGSGSLSTKGMRFTHSAGITLVERDMILEKTAPEMRAGEWHSPLGSWKLNGDLLPQAGDGWKKRCQEAGIPIFFRAWIPWAQVKGKKQLLLSDFSPSELGSWFFIPSEKSDALALGSLSKAKKHQALRQQRQQISKET
jgi:tRNA(Ile)-lysidine synthetase-like protein